MFSQELINAATALLNDARKQNIKFATAESCTGGLIGGLLTEIAGSSDVYERGFITYSNEAKHELIEVPIETLNTYGAVSHQTANAMASGVINHSHADVAVSVTGVAGPSGGSLEKPVGLVYFGLAKRGSLTRTFEQRFDPNLSRDQIRIKSVEFALKLFNKSLNPND